MSSSAAAADASFPPAVLRDAAARVAALLKEKNQKVCVAETVCSSLFPTLSPRETLFHGSSRSEVKLCAIPTTDNRTAPADPPRPAAGHS